MNKYTLQNPSNPYHRITTHSLEYARMLLSLGWKRVEAQVVTVKPEAKRP